MSNFDLAVLTVLKNEGGFVNNPNDPGGATNFGISLRTLKNLDYLNFDLDDDGELTPTDIKKLDYPKAKEFYKTQWWDKYGYGRIINQALATKIFDTAVNVGHTQAIKLLQRACILSGGNPKLEVDGVLGLRTLNECNTLMSDKILIYYRKEQLKFYNKLIDKNIKLVVFRDEWTKRANA